MPSRKVIVFSNEEAVDLGEISAMWVVCCKPLLQRGG